MHRVTRKFLQGLKHLPYPKQLNQVRQRARIWLLENTGPHGAFTLVLTNDPDHGKAEDYARVFNGLNSLELKATTAVFCTIEDDGSDLAKHCYKGETHTLADPEYKELMLSLHENGHEIAFHGYSQVSNTREKFIKGLEIFRETFGHYPFTYVEHGGYPKKHPPGMWKRETLAVDGMNPESPYYVWDIIREKFGCVWAWHDLLDNDYSAKNFEDLFYRIEGVLFFRRAKLHYLDRMIWDVSRHGGVFPGYTHFGFEGYPKEPQYRFENWTGTYLKTALNGLEQILRRHDVTSITVQELVQTSLAHQEGERL